jgi:hypothetical protein
MATRSRKTASSRPKTTRRKAGSARRKSGGNRETSSKRWSQRVTEESDALDLKRGVFTLRDEGNRRLAETLGGAQFTPQGRRLSLGALDADLLCQSCRQDIAENPARAAGARQGRIEAAVRAGVTVIAPRLPLSSPRRRGAITTVVMILQFGSASH